MNGQRRGTHSTYQAAEQTPGPVCRRREKKRRWVWCPLTRHLHMQASGRCVVAVRAQRNAVHGNGHASTPARQHASTPARQQSTRAKLVLVGRRMPGRHWTRMPHLPVLHHSTIRSSIRRVRLADVYCTKDREIRPNGWDLSRHAWGCAMAAVGVVVVAGCCVMPWVVVLLR